MRVTQMLALSPQIHIHQNGLSIPLRAVVVANHPYLSPDDWVRAEEIEAHWGDNDYGYSLLHIPIIRTRIFQALLGKSSSWAIAMKPIGFSKLHHQLQCLQLPSEKGCDFLKQSLHYLDKVVIFPEGGAKTGVIRSGFARVALHHRLPIVYVQLPPVISLYGGDHQRGAIIKTIYTPHSADDIQKCQDIFQKEISYI